MNEEPHERLAWARTQAGYATAADAARAMGVEVPTYQGHENGSRGLRRGVAIRYAAFFKVSLEWLLDGKGEPKQRSHMGNTPDQLPAMSGDVKSGLIEIGGAEFASIGRYDAALSAGPGSLIDPMAEPLGFYLIERQWLQTITGAAPEHLALVRVDGDSMEKTLFDGDWVMIDRSQTRVSRQGIYAMRVGDDAWIKRMMVDLATKKVRIISDNSVWPEQQLSAGDIDVLGRFVALVWRKSMT